MFGLLLGFIFGGTVGYVAGTGSRAPSSGGSSSTVPPEASRWNGSVGTVRFEVYRNGPTWAWSTDGGAGAESTAAGALRQVVRHIFEESPGAGSDVDMARGDSAVRGAVRHAENDAATPWHWLVGTRDGAGNSAPAALGKAKQRGVAVLQLIDALAPWLVPS